MLKPKFSFFWLLVVILPQFIFAQLGFSDLDYGSHPVGFTHYLATDSTREYQRTYDFDDSTIYRPIPISVWYPAKEQTTGQRLTVNDYLRIVAEEAEWENLPDDLMLGWFGYGTDSVYQTRRKLTTKAVSGLPYHDGSHSLIVYSPGYERSSVENFALCEYLASKGYVVISSPSRGTDQVFLSSGTFRDIETQTRDFEYLVKEARSRYVSQQTNVVALGYSFGGLASVYAASRNDYVSAIISLDGAIKYQYEKLKQSPYFNSGEFKIPFVHFSQKDIPEEMLEAEGLPASINTDFDFFDELGEVNAFKIRMEKLSHTYFTSMGVLMRPRDPRQDPEWKEINSSHVALCRLVLTALGSFKTTPDMLRSQVLRHQAIGRTDYSMVEYKKHHLRKESVSMDFAGWNELMRLENYRDLIYLHSEYSFLRDMPVKLYSPKEWELNTLALKLAFDPKTYEAGIRVGEFATAVYPESANLYDTLGEIYLLDKRKEKAILNFKKSLKLHPENGNAIKRLKELKVD